MLEKLESADFDRFWNRILLPSGSNVWNVFKLVCFASLRGYGLVLGCFDSLFSVKESICYFSVSILKEHVTTLSIPLLFISDFDF